MPFAVEVFRQLEADRGTVPHLQWYRAQRDAEALPETVSGCCWALGFLQGRPQALWARLGLLAFSAPLPSPPLPRLFKGR